MTPKATINSGLVGGDRYASLARYAARLYEQPSPVMGVVELVPVDRTTPVDPSSKKEPVVRLRIDLLEIAPAGATDEVLRQAAVALKTARTANGTLGGDQDVQLSEDTLRLIGDRVSDQESARLRIVLDWLLTTVEKVLDNDKLRPADVKLELGRAVTKAAASRDAGVQLDLTGAP
jgi:hypothetical protein